MQQFEENIEQLYLSRKLTISSTVEEYRANPVGRDQFEMLQDVQQECAGAILRHNQIRSLLLHSVLSTLQWLQAYSSFWA